MTEMADLIVLLAALASFGVLVIGWMTLPVLELPEESAEPSGLPVRQAA
jgi:hypothetical protein